MTGIPVRIRAIVDPCGRVLVHEVEKLALGESYSYGPDGKPIAIRPPDLWYRHPACRTHVFEVVLPVPTITTPQITYIPPEDA